jgi:hypothetical protein
MKTAQPLVQVAVASRRRSRSWDIPLESWDDGTRVSLEGWRNEWGIVLVLGQFYRCSTFLVTRGLSELLLIYELQMIN